MKSQKKLIINADDYGACDAVNAAVEELALAGLLGGVSVLTNGSRRDSAITFLRDHPHLSAGVHLNLIEGPPMAAPTKIAALLGRDGQFLDRGRLLARWALHPFAVSRAVETEWRAQIEFLLQAGLQITHADSHQHLHAFPPAFRLAVKLCREYQIPALRLPRERNRIAARTLTATALNANIAIARRTISAASLHHNDHFHGFKRAGGYGIQELLADLPLLQDGVTELALHPSTTNFAPYPTLRGNDEREALLSPAFQAQIKQSQIALISWHEVQSS
jgi:chitin disaccharide deacetylase